MPATLPMQTGRPTVMNLIGAILDGRYRLESLLGEGGMGAVYETTDLEDGSTVAVKVLLEELGDQPEQRERFEREARALFGLAHPHILSVSDFGILEGRPYLVMERLVGQTLDDLLEEEESLSADQAIALMEQILEGLAFAHASGALHRDLKSENVHVGTPEARVVKLLDFGLVKFTDSERWGTDNKLTVMGSVFGTPAYMAPEQCTGAAVDQRGDVYAMGVIFYEALTGEWPFMKETRLDMFRAHLIEEPPSVAGFVEGPVDRIDAFIAKAMHKLPSGRFTDGADMLVALRKLKHPASPASFAPPAIVPSDSQGRSLPWRTIGIVAGVALLLLIVMVGLFAIL